eukprot:gnl/TRDRNA2_/TRDRNA2_176658_c0_seq1.p1 gnl/TRDRNA2_/TRDRNA2_176658_c0~~gnl/TRDRNA2_/TRDRNA2_176658_c0_seq1.p1  ORF type:complete len:451 (+),score=90.04 gnl/TRDRNA2_/TRDRNA2_176658_c0_seq1:69-1421(+)
MASYVATAHGFGEVFSSRRRNHMLSSHRKDGLIAWVKELLNHSFVLDATQTYEASFQNLEQLIEEEVKSSRTPLDKREVSQLRQLVPTISMFHTPLPLVRAFRDYDEKYCVTPRRCVPPTFNEIRHIFNLAQVMALEKSLKLISFDGDQTLYDDGANFAHDSELSIGIRSILLSGIYVALVTGAGYGWKPEMYETRLRGLLDGFAQDSTLTDKHINQFFVVGGECNFFFQAVRKGGRVVLEAIPEEIWTKRAEGTEDPRKWDEKEAQRVLDVAEETMKAAISEMRLRSRIIRKTRSVGMIPGGKESISRVPVGHGSTKLKREALDEVVLRCGKALAEAQPRLALPYCCSNGGSDSFVDVGNKRVGVQVMQGLVHVKPHESLHVGDQFFDHLGNDFHAREVSPCIWIINPKETEKILGHWRRLKKQLHDGGSNGVTNGEPAAKKAKISPTP